MVWSIVGRVADLGPGRLIGAMVKCPVLGSAYDLKMEKNLKRPSYCWPRQPTVRC